MKVDNVKNLILKNFPFEPNEGQKKLTGQLADFILCSGPKELFLLKGYAGTGKTSVLSALIKAAPKTGKPTVLLAPTGRAAKVLAFYSQKQAFTIHKKIYTPRTKKDGTVSLNLQENFHKNALFIVDEASMIPGAKKSKSGSFFSDTDLLSDLVKFVYSGDNCKLMLIGDTAQLPPVGLDISPAMDTNYLERFFELYVKSFELKEVMRQAFESGILANATIIRNKITAGKFNLPCFDLSNYTDILRTDSTILEDALNSAFSTNSDENPVVITRSNKRANIYNREIRKRILYREGEIGAGDLMMVVKNNYYWLSSDSVAGFIANGDTVEILKIKKIYEFYGFRFADVILRLVDYPDEEEFDAKLLLDTIMSETPSLSFNDSKKLFDEIFKDYKETGGKRKIMEKVRNDPFYNALQVKFAYSLTCHKTQGGQWNTIFIDQPYFREDFIDIEFFRWLYTAVTRATKKLYLVNFIDKFFEE